MILDVSYLTLIHDFEVLFLGFFWGSIQGGRGTGTGYMKAREELPVDATLVNRYVYSVRVCNLFDRLPFLNGTSADIRRQLHA